MVAPGPGPADPLYPLSLRMQGRLAVVIGGGTVALRRVAGLRAAGASIMVVAPELSPSLADQAARGFISARRREYQSADLDGAWLVLACTNRPEVNAAVAADAERQRIWCVRADDGAGSPAWVPAVGRSGAVTVAVNVGRDPRLAAELRDACVDTVQAAGQRGRRPGGRRQQDGAGPRSPVPGRVSIVGAGPGDPGLITAAGLRLLRDADVVIADRLAPAELLADLSPHVHVIDAAKVPGGPAMRQEQISELLIEHAQAGRAVVRLKGGDPFVLGRGAEEVQACLAAGVAVRVVPGVTSAVAVPAAAGIPVTHRGVSQGFTVVSGHVSPADPASTVDWAALAGSRTTLILLMAIEHLAAIADTLQAAGLAGDTPAACVSNGWTPRQQVLTAPLRGLAAAVSDKAVTSPAVIVIGDVAGMADGGPLGDPQRPLATLARQGRRVLVIGGARSGKSQAAERMLAGHRQVDYVATGPCPDGDAEWADRVRAHAERRPADWRTIETLDLGLVLRTPGADAPVLIDCLSTWLAAVMEDCGIWTGRTGADEALADQVERLLAAWRGTDRTVVAVSSEVGSGVVPGTPSGRRFRDELGSLNTRIAADCDEVWLCTAGIPQRLR